MKLSKEMVDCMGGVPEATYRRALDCLVTFDRQAALSHIRVLTYLALAIAGASWMSVMSTYNTATQTSVPPWVRARATSMHTLCALGSFAIGSAFWGAVSDLIGKPLPFDRFDQLRAAMTAEVPELGRDGLVDLPWSPPSLSADVTGAMTLPVKDFYLTNAICRASPTMHRCSEELIHGRTLAEAAE